LNFLHRFSKPPQIQNFRSAVTRLRCRRQGNRASFAVMGRVCSPSYFR